jgi:hypothetical protein
MPEIPDEQSNDGFDPRIQTEEIAFKSDELVTCRSCGRANPPTRLKCLYCASDLELKDTTAVKPMLRKLEDWERGFNVILRETADVDVQKAASYLSVEQKEISDVIGAGTPLPLVRVESETEAEVVVKALGKYGLKCVIVSDIDLNVDKLPTRLSAIEFGDGHLVLTDFNTHQAKSVALDDLALIVPGLLTRSKVDSLEKKGRGGKTKLIEETPTALDEAVIDIYLRSDPNGFRIHLSGFDFSCLGDDKGLLAVENMRLLVIALKENAPNAKVVADYSRIRHALDHIWEIESRKDPQGLKRAGLGKVEFGSVASTSNLRQFTKYSRLQWHLL